MTDTLIKDGYTRYIYQDCVYWIVKRTRRIEYCVVRFPFVPDYHLCDLLEDAPGTASMPVLSERPERPLQQFKTLTQALAVLRVIEGSQS